MAAGDMRNVLIDEVESREKCGGGGLKRSGLRAEEQVRGTESRVSSGGASSEMTEVRLFTFPWND